MNINKEFYLKKSLPFFKDLSEEEKTMIYNASHIEQYKAGELIYSKYNACTGLVLVAQGELRSFMSSLSGKEITQSKLSEVMEVLEKVVFFSLEYRLSEHLIDQYYLKNALKFKVTHEAIANDLGSSREVISRILKRFEKNNLIHISRGYIEIINLEKLKLLCQ